MFHHHRVLTRLVNTPLAISQDKLEIISSEVVLKLLAGQQLASGVAEPTTKSIQADSTTQSVAVINVFDSLVAKGGAGESGYTSYEAIKKETQQCLDNGASKIIYYIDSPGGEVAGLFGLTSFLASVPELYGVETVAITDGYMTSAAYAIGASCQQVYATESSVVGSIGVIMTLVDVAKADEKAGYNYQIIRSKDLKALYNPHEPLSQEVIDTYTAKLSELDAMFNSDVAKHRPNLTIEAIVSMQADSFLGSKALSLGLIDGLVSSIDEVVTGKATPTSSLPNQILTKGEIMTLDETKAKLAAVESELTTMKTTASVAVAEAIKAERTRCLDILAAGSTLRISAEQVTKRISAGTSKEDSLDVFTAIAEAIGATTAIDTATEVASTLTESTLTGASNSPMVKVGESEVSMADIVNFAKGIK